MIPYLSGVDSILCDSKFDTERLDALIGLSSSVYPSKIRVFSGDFFYPFAVTALLLWGRGGISEPFRLLF